MKKKIIDIKAIDIVEKDFSKNDHVNYIKPLEQIKIEKIKELEDNGFSIFDIWNILKKLPILFKLILLLIKLKDLIMADSKTTQAGNTKLIGGVIATVGLLLNMFNVEFDYSVELQSALLLIGTTVYGFFSRKQAIETKDSE